MKDDVPLIAAKRPLFWQGNFFWADQGLLKSFVFTFYFLKTLKNIRSENIFQKNFSIKWSSRKKNEGWCPFDRRQAASVLTG